MYNLQFGFTSIPTLFDITVVPDTFNDDKHVVALLIVVVPDIYNDVFIDVPTVFNLIASHVPLLVFNIMLFNEGNSIVKSPTRLYILLVSCQLI